MYQEVNCWKFQPSGVAFAATCFCNLHPSRMLPLAVLEQKVQQPCTLCIARDYVDEKEPASFHNGGQPEMQRCCDQAL